MSGAAPGPLEGGATGGSQMSSHPSLGGLLDRRAAAAPISGRPPEVIEAGPVVLRRHTPGDGPALVDAVNRSLDQLRPWMPWAQAPASEKSIGAFLERSRQSWEHGLEFGYAMLPARPAAPPPASAATSESNARVEPDIVGACGLHILSDPGVAEIGYWVRSDRTGAGVATAAARALTEAALRLDEVEQVEIHCDAGNWASRAVPPKLGYRLDRIDPRPPGFRTPGETDRHMVWIFPA